MKLALDHVVYVVADLESAIRDFEAATGCRPMPGGSHPQMGTCNALVGFGPGCYLEIMGPDPAQDSWSEFAARLAELKTPELCHWALRCDDLPVLADTLRDSGLAPTPPFETSRQSPVGERLVWTLMGLPGKGGAWPFFIDWRDCTHPSQDAPQVGEIGEFIVSLPEEVLTSNPMGTATGVEFHAGSPGLTLGFDSARGPIEWSQASPTGLFG